jgi:hypothetical protein
MDELAAIKKSLATLSADRVITDARANQWSKLLVLIQVWHPTNKKMKFTNKLTPNSNKRAETFVRMKAMKQKLNSKSSSWRITQWYPQRSTHPHGFSCRFCPKLCTMLQGRTRPCVAARFDRAGIHVP